MNLPICASMAFADLRAIASIFSKPDAMAAESASKSVFSESEKLMESNFDFSGSEVRSLDL